MGKVWLRGDGTCTLRYTPRLREGHDTGTVGPLLARLHPDDASAASYLGHRVRGCAHHAPGRRRRHGG